MLQQTTVAAVGPRFTRFIALWPTIEALAAAPQEELMSEWAGLGYYARARNLHACAKLVAERGGFPRTEGKLRTLPGIGDYTAAAIAAIAFGQKATVIDTNVQRVATRLMGLERPIADGRAEVRALVEAMTPVSRPGDFAQAMMDLGATVCRPRSPSCRQCPLAADCVAFASGEPERFPGPKAKRDRPHRYGVAWWIEERGSVWLVRRPAKGLLGGMPALPGPKWSDSPITGQDRAPITIRHGFTHFTLDLAVVPKPGRPHGEGWWHALDSARPAGLPTLYRRAVEAMTGDRFANAA